MAGFRYRMQSILNIKLKMETQARQEFAQARQALDREEEALEQLIQRKKAYEEKAQALLKGKLDMLEISATRNAIECMEEYIIVQRMRVQKAEEQLEAARVKLTEVIQERKVHETLREKAFEEFLMEEKQRESKEIDQLTSYTYGQRLQEANEVSVEDSGNGKQ